jgi:hypothetical protein
LLCQYGGEYLYSYGICGGGEIPVVPVIVMGGRYNITNVYIKQYKYDIFTSFQPWWIAKNRRQRHKEGSFYQSIGGGGTSELTVWYWIPYTPFI